MLRPEVTAWSFYCPTAVDGAARGQITPRMTRCKLKGGSSRLGSAAFQMSQHFKIKVQQRHRKTRKTQLAIKKEKTLLLFSRTEI